MVKMVKNKRTEELSMRLTPQEYQQLRKTANVLSITMSDVLRHGISTLSQLLDEKDRNV